MPSRLKFDIDWSHFVTHGGALSLVLALICIFGSLYVIFKSQGQSSWHRTTAIVTQSRIATNPPGSQHSYRTLFMYEYEVNGKQYHSDRYSFASVGGDQTVGVKLYKRGDKVSVYFNPLDPSVAVLKLQSPGFFVYMVFLIGSMFFIASMGILLARDFGKLFSVSGIKSVYFSMSGSREKAIEKLLAVENKEDIEALINALENPLLLECIQILKDKDYPYLEGREGFIKLERSAHFIYKTTKINFNTAKQMMRLLADKQGINLTGISE